MFGADLRSLAVLRMGIALLIIYDVLQRSRDLVAHYSDFGLLSRTEAINEGYSRWLYSIHFMSGAWQFQAMLFLLLGLFAAALLLGYKTRLATVVSWVLLSSLQTRNLFVNGGGDHMLRIMLFWCMFLPLGARLSIDSLRCAETDATDTSPSFLSMGTAAYVIQILYVYWFSVLLKTGTEWRGEGSAIYYAMNVDYIATGLGQVLLEFPLLMKAMTYGTLAFESIGPLLLISPFLSGPLRIAGICGFILLHFGILLTLRIGIFPIVNVVAMLFFLPSIIWDRVAARLQQDPRIPFKIYYDADCAFCVRSMEIIRRVGGLPSSVTVPAQKDVPIEPVMRPHNFWIVEAEGTRYFGYAALTKIASASPLLRPIVVLVKLAPTMWLGQLAYGWLAAHRRLANRLDRSPDAEPVPGLLLSRIRNIAILALLGYVLLWNIGTVQDSGIKLSERVRSLGYLLRLDQEWRLFAPHPPKNDGWYVITGKLRNGQTVDLLTDKAVTWSKPASVSGAFKNHHWRKYFEIMRTRTALLPGYAAYLCRDWNRRHYANEALAELGIFFMLERTLPKYEYSPIEKRLLLSHSCASEQRPPSRPQEGSGL